MAPAVAMAAHAAVARRQDLHSCLCHHQKPGLGGVTWLPLSPVAFEGSAHIDPQNILAGVLGLERMQKKVRKPRISRKIKGKHGYEKIGNMAGALSEELRFRSAMFISAARSTTSMRVIFQSPH